MSTEFKLIWFTSYGARNWDLADFGSYDWRRSHVYREMATLLEQRGGFEAIVFADSPAIAEIDGDRDTFVRYGIEGNFHDPMPMLAAIAASTKHIGLVGTLSTSVYPPFLLARLMATFDHLSNGRAGWNIVTSSGDAVAGNFGLDHLPPTLERYDRAEEFLRLCDMLWDSWEPDAVLLDRNSGRFADASKVHEADFRGVYYRARGPMTLPRSPQGRPVIMQAGGSERGRQFAAEHAEIVISHRNSPDEMKQFRDDLRSRMVAVGRDPDSCKIFFTVCPFIGDTAADADARRAERLARATVNVEVGLAYLSSRVGFDFRGWPLDAPVDPAKVTVAGAEGILQQYTGGPTPLTLREIAMREAMKETYVVTGTPRQVADQMAEMMDYVGGDGLAIRDTMVPSSVVPMVDRVVPVLRERRLVREGYRYDRFRDNLFDTSSPTRTGLGTDDAILTLGGAR